MKRNKLVQALALAGGVLGSVGFLGTAQAVTLSNGTLTLDVNATGSIKDVTNATAGFWNFGTPTIGFGISSSAGFGREDANCCSGPVSNPFSGTTVGGPTTIVASGTWGSLSYIRTYSLSGFDVNISTVVTNGGTSRETFKWFDSGDPDQGIPRGGGFASFNDVLPAYAIATNSSGTPPDLVKWSRTDPTAVLTFTPGSLGIFDASTLNSVYATPYDPNLANQDIGIAIIWEKTLEAGASVTLNYIQSYGTPEEVLPEPGTIVLFGAGVIGLLGVRRRQRD
ncbi:MAG: PEP-CTERM sorting domain-containing protein [Dokdonella sp.]|nr:MAG: PEP-CTERM sorting domain-containing protein [Dokdonella sp.]